MALKKGRRALENAQEILQPPSNLKINEEEEECGWDVFTEEILPRLPANQLLTLKSVCKNWYRIISNPCFVRLHLNIYNQNQNQIRVLMPMTYCSMLREYKINCDGLTEQEIPYPPAMRNWESTILGSCDGLLCLLLRKTHEHHTIAVYNPSTGKYLCVESPLKHNYFVSCCWFGRHPCSGKYVLVLGKLDDEVGVYKFNTRRSNASLEKIHSTSTLHPQGVIGFHDQRIGTLLHGAIHWPLIYRYGTGNFSCSAISVYHLDDNKYFEFAAPVQRDISLYHFKLGVAEGCLFAFFMAYDDDDDDDDVDVFELWIMKEYKVHQSWIKYVNIQGLENIVVTSLAFFPNRNDLILHPDLGLIKYTFNDDKALFLMDDDKAIMCADSLVSPEIVGT